MSKEETPVSEIMSAPVRTVSRETPIPEAARILRENNIGSLVVEGEIIEGIVTETDIVTAVGQEMDLQSTTIGEIMTEPVVSIRPQESVAAAGRRMGKNTVKKLPVTVDGEPIGIVTTTDLAHFVTRS
ncbi:MAG: CBS domain-containing protein [Halovenus sp.]|uniref:CBS domain-containing protein n=1 Tax=Halovenus amylolytica TaxID=2500550 RepID=UPI000FE3496A